MALPRYAFPDPYILAELGARYDAAAAKGRIELLAELYEADDCVPPSEIIASATSDSYVEVRRWIARYGRDLDYRVPDFSEPLGPTVYDRNLVHRLRHDADLLVRPTFGRILRSSKECRAPVRRVRCGSVSRPTSVYDFAYFDDIEMAMEAKLPENSAHPSPRRLYRGLRRTERTLEEVKTILDQISRFYSLSWLLTFACVVGLATAILVRWLR
jgi:hypothetical protein